MAGYDQIFTGFMDKRPFHRRANPLVDPEDEEFKKILHYFTSLLRGTQLTIDEILEKAFDEHEIALFTPATAPPQLVQWQKENTQRYTMLLQTRFKDIVPSLQMKMAFLYFGLPVEPMRPGAVLVPRPKDFEMFDDDEPIVDTEPLQFLDDYTELMGGVSENRVKPNEFYSLFRADKYHYNVMGLRGGAGDEDEMDVEEVEDLEEPDLELQEASTAVFGYQGVRYCSEVTWPDFVTAVDGILGMNPRYDYGICLGFWAVDPDNPSSEEGVLQETATGMLRHNLTTKPSLQDPIFSLFFKYYGKGKDSSQVRPFVHFEKEKHPDRFNPNPYDPSVLTLADRLNHHRVYLRLPRQMLEKHKPSEFSLEFHRAMNLMPDPIHSYMEWNGVDGELTYGPFEPPVAFWNVVRHQSVNQHAMFAQFTQHRIPLDWVPILVPGFFKHTPLHPEETIKTMNAQQREQQKKLYEQGFKREDFKVDGTGKDTRGVEKIFRALQVALPIPSTAQQPSHIDIWVSGDEFLNVKRKPGRISWAQNSIEPLIDWRLFMTGWLASRVHHRLARQSIVVRPVFEKYHIRAAGQPNVKSRFIDINYHDIHEFRSLICIPMLKAWDLKNESQVVRIQQGAEGSTHLKPEFVVNIRTTVDEWQWIQRNITDYHIAISVDGRGISEKLDATSQPFGSRYDTSNVLTLAKVEQSRPHPYSASMNNLFQNSNNTWGTAARSSELRKSLYWNTASLFTDPTKPTMPIHGPPLESIIRTGPNMPGVSIAMMTPTEVNRLQREVHSLRNQLLDRIRHCPYADCEGYFRFTQGEALDKHMREDHAVLICFLCGDKNQLLPFYDNAQIRQHFLDHHYDDIKQLVLPGPESDADLTAAAKKVEPTFEGDLKFRYCNRCGRDEILLNGQGERLHHMTECERLREGQPKRFQKHCIRCKEVTFVANKEEVKQPATEACDNCHWKPGSEDVDGSYCTSCGMRYSGSEMGGAERRIHIANCPSISGHEWDFCGHCGVDLTSSSKPDRLLHEFYCQQRLAKFAKQEGRGQPQTKCSLFRECGVLTTRMTPEQLRIHMQYQHTFKSAADNFPPAWLKDKKGGIKKTIGVKLSAAEQQELAAAHYKYEELMNKMHGKPNKMRSTPYTPPDSMKPPGNMPIGNKPTGNKPAGNKAGGKNNKTGNKPPPDSSSSSELEPDDDSDDGLAEYDMAKPNNNKKPTGGAGSGKKSETYSHISGQTSLSSLPAVSSSNNDDEAQGNKKPANASAKAALSALLPWISPTFPKSMTMPPPPVPEADPAGTQRKRKRNSGGNNGPSFRSTPLEDDPSEEYSEVSSAPDPVSNLDPDAPRSPKKRLTAGSKRGKSPAKRVATMPVLPAISSSSESYASSTTSSVYGGTSQDNTNRLRGGFNPDDMFRVANQEDQEDEREDDVVDDLVQLQLQHDTETLSTTSTDNTASTATLGRRAPKTPAGQRGRRAVSQPVGAGVATTPATATRTGRTVRATRAAVEAAGGAGATSEDTEMQQQQQEGASETKTPGGRRLRARK